MFRSVQGQATTFNMENLLPSKTWTQNNLLPYLPTQILLLHSNNLLYSSHTIIPISPYPIPHTITHTPPNLQQWILSHNSIKRCLMVPVKTTHGDRRELDIRRSRNEMYSQWNNVYCVCVYICDLSDLVML